MKVQTLAHACLVIGTSAYSCLAAAASSPEEARKAIRDAGGAVKVLSASANATAKMAPHMLDQDTELTGAVATDLTVAHYMRLVNQHKNDIKDITALQQEALNRNTSAACTAPMSGALINDFGAEIKYLYYSKSREYLFAVTVDKASCAKQRR